MLVVVCSLFFAGVPSPQATQANDSKPQYTSDGRFIDVPDLAPIIKRVSTPQGIVDPEFNRLVEKPSRYYTDFYGIQALKNADREQVLRDFVPKYASLGSQDEHSFELRFKSGWTARFYPHSALKIQTAVLPYDHMYASGATFTEFLQHLAEFRAILRKENLESVYLIPNEHYRDELVVYDQMRKNPPAAQVIYDPQLTAFSRQSNAVMIYPEVVHGNLAGYQKFTSFLGAHKDFTWTGMEMLTSSLQPALDAYSTAPENSPKFAEARRKIVQYFSTAWQVGKPTSGEDNEYFKIVELLRRDHAHVYGLESASLAWIVFRYGQTPFGAAVRSYLWSKQVPLTGRGIVYGGSGHFTDSQSINFQDFLRLRNRSVTFYTVRDRNRAGDS